MRVSFKLLSLKIMDLLKAINIVVCVKRCKERQFASSIIHCCVGLKMFIVLTYLCIDIYNHAARACVYWKVGFHTCLTWRRTLRSRRTLHVASAAPSRSVSWWNTSNVVLETASSAASVTSRALLTGIRSTSPSTAAIVGGRARPSPTDDSSTGSPSRLTSNRLATLDSLYAVSVESK